MAEAIEILSAQELEGMRAACKLAADMLSHVGKMVTSGISTQDIDDEVVKYAKEHGATNGPLGYHGFPKSVCTSINEVVCHGIPDKKRIFAPMMNTNQLVQIEI